MYKLQPKKKILLQSYEHLVRFKRSKFTKKKWSIFKRKSRFDKDFKPERKGDFYKKRLFEKQRLRFYYGSLQNYKLKNIIKKLKKKKKIDILKNFIVILENRLDINLIKLKFVKSIFKARQLINHKKIQVNGKIVNKPNFLLKKGDFITIFNKKRIRKEKFLKKKKNHFFKKKILINKFLEYKKKKLVKKALLKNKIFEIKLKKKKILKIKIIRNKIKFIKNKQENNE